MLMKICGMRDLDNISAVAGLNPDFMGFIFYKKSRRYVGDGFMIPDGFPKGIKKVGVFVDATDAEIEAEVTRHQLDFVQLHGDETASQCCRLKESGVGVIKVFSVDNAFDFEATTPYTKAVDYFLFDTKGVLRGGNGLAFDWQVLKRYKGDVPFFLSGGISPENIDQALTLDFTRMVGVDANSGVELAPGTKDSDKIKAIRKSIHDKT